MMSFCYYDKVFLNYDKVFFVMMMHLIPKQWSCRCTLRYYIHILEFVPGASEELALGFAKHPSINLFKSEMI